MIKKICFSNYKAFKDRQEIDIRPITVLIGKNSSGKSAISKIFTMLGNSLSANIDVPLLLTNNGVELGKEFKDLVYSKGVPSLFDLQLIFSNSAELDVQIAGEDSRIYIRKWEYVTKGINLKYELLDKEYVYANESKHKFTGFFKGFIPTKLKNIESGKDIILPSFSELNLNVDYIGPFRIFPPSTFHLTGENQFNKIGFRGEKAYQILGNSRINNTPLIEEVGNWYMKYFDGWKFDIETKRKPYLEAILKKENGDFYVNIAHVGQGMSQALPIIVRAFMDTQPSIIVLEQPELHLHPAAHGDLAELFANSALKFNHKYIIETHSENILLRLRKLIVDSSSKLKSDDVVIYWVDYDEDGHYVDKITINEYGELSDWPQGVFNENVEEIINIKNAIEQKKSKQ